MFALLIPCAVAQDAQHRVLYGQGVHAYYNGDYESAVRYLTATISKDTDDPRSYYFRGLANAKLGNDEASLADLKKGAAIEALDDRGVYKISTALQRIQGQPRLQIEKLRKQARLELVAAEKVRLQARYEQQQSDEAAALRKPAAPSIPTDAETAIRQSNPFAPSNIAGVKSNPANVTSSKSNTIPGVDDKDPLANVQGNTPTPMPTPVPANPTPPAGNNPFAAGNKPMPANPTPPAGNNPFAPGNKPVPANPTPPAGNNPFAPGNKPVPANPTPPAGNNPFAPGNTPAPAANPANPTNPAAPQAGGGGGTLGSIFRSLNPFGGGSPEPNAESPLDQLKNLIPGVGPAPGAAPAPPAPPIPAPGGNPFK
jgi:hypothetical protein